MHQKEKVLDAARNIEAAIEGFLRWETRPCETDKEADLAIEIYEFSLKLKELLNAAEMAE